MFDQPPTRPSLVGQGSSERGSSHQPAIGPPPVDRLRPKVTAVRNDERLGGAPEVLLLPIDTRRGATRGERLDL
jgi:hypothetical protein